MNRDFLDSCNKRDDLQWKSARTKNPIDQFMSNRACNHTVQLKREIKCLYFQTSIQNSWGDSKKLWKVLKRLLKNANSRDTIKEIGNETDPIKIVETLNSFFANIGPNLADKIPATNFQLNNEPFDVPILNLKHTNPEEVEKLLLNISDSKATGDDGIPV